MAALAGVALLNVTAAVGAPGVEVPDGPRLAVLKLTSKTGRSELATLGPRGGAYRRVLSIPPAAGLRFGQVGGPAWSPDGTLLVFTQSERGTQMISVVPATGGPPQPVPGTKDGFLPVFTPDGRSIAFTRQRLRHDRRGFPVYESSSVWIVDLETGMRRQLTRWRDNLDQYASSFSPDGTTLLVTRIDDERSGEPELVALRFDGRASGLLVGEGALPVYSPDGSKIALFRQVERSFKVKGGPRESGLRRIESNTELYVVNADGSRLRRLTHTPNKDEVFASWDPSGERIAYSRFRRQRFNDPNSIMQINADGTCPTEVILKRGAIFYGPTWQPGPGREAGKLAC